MTTENEQINNWLKEELETLKEQLQQYDDIPSLKFEEGKITTFMIVDISKPFEKWVEQETNLVKKIIPVEHKGEQKKLWLNVRNPLYTQIIESLNNGVNTFSVFQIGSGQSTKYSLVKD